MAQVRKTTNLRKKVVPKKQTTPPQTSKEIKSEIIKVEAGEVKEIDYMNKTYTKEIKVTYRNPPIDESIEINKQTFPISNSPQTVLISDIPADGKEFDVEVQFSNIENSKKSFTNLFTSPKAPDKAKINSGYAVIGFYLALGIIFYFSIEDFRDWVNKNIISVLLIAAIIIGSIFITYLQKAKFTSSINYQVRLLFIIIIPFLFALTLVFILIPPIYHVAIFRSLFLIIVILLPAILYYLFLSRKKASLLQAFITNLSRLGLLAHDDGHGVSSNSSDNLKEVKRKIRIMSYIQKFELLYGAIPGDLAEEIIIASDPKNTNPKVPEFHKYLEGKSMSGVFTTEMIIPVIISTVLIAIGWLMILPPWVTFAAANSLDRFIEVFQPTKAAVLFAFLGAYFFSIQMLFRRYYRKDLRSNAYLSVILRIILAIIGTWACTKALSLVNSNQNTETIASLIDTQKLQTSNINFNLDTIVNNSDTSLIVNDFTQDLDSSNIVADTISMDSTLLKQALMNLVSSEKDDTNEPPFFIIVGFVIGVFPPIAWQMILAIFTTITGARYFLPSLKTAMPIRHLDGLTIWHEAKLEEEDVENIQNMATANIVDLILNTGYPANRIVDWIDQAILYNQLGPDKKNNDPDMNQRVVLRKHGIRTASALVAVHKKSVTHGDTNEFEKILEFKNRSKIRSIVDTLENNPNLKLIMNWKGIN